MAHKVAVLGKSQSYVNKRSFLMKTAKGSKKSSRKYTSYEQVRSIAERPLAKRKELPIGRGGAVEAPRKFHLSADEVTVLKQQMKDGDTLPNPHNRGFWHYFIETMKRLGLNRNHSAAVVISKFQERTREADTKDAEGKTFWVRWSKKDGRNTETEKDWHGKFEQNVEVLQRLGGLTPYGLRLMEVGQKVLGTKGACINIINGTSGTVMYRLDTNNDRPVNELRTRGALAGVAPKPKKAKAKKTVKAETAVKAETPEKKTPKARKPRAPKATPVAEEATEAPEAMVQSEVRQ
jgi:hypothetical protein